MINKKKLHEVDCKKFKYSGVNEFPHNSSKLILDESLFKNVRTLNEYYYPAKEKYTAVINGEEVKFSRVWGGHRFTDEECDSLVKGDTITITISNSHRPYSVVDVVGKLEAQIYNGHSFTGFKADKFINNRSDKQELEQTLDFPLGIDISELKAKIEDDIHKAHTSTEYEITSFYICEQFDNTDFYCLDISAVGSKALSVIVVVQYDKVVDYLENKGSWAQTLKKSKYGNKYTQTTKLRDDAIFQKQKEEIEERDKAIIDEVRSWVWETVYLDDYLYQFPEVGKQLEVWLRDNVKHFNDDTELFKYKTKPDYRFDSSDVGVSAFYIAPIIKRLPKEFIVNYFSGPAGYSNVVSASSVDKIIEPEAKYVIMTT